MFLERNKIWTHDVKDFDVPSRLLEVNMWKRLIIVILLVLIAAIAGVVRSHSSGISEFKGLVSHNSVGETREEKRETYELAPGARVEVFNINGSVNIETSDSKTAEIYIERTAANPESLSRRRVAIECTSGSLRVYGERTSTGFWARLFGSNPSERITLKLPRQISLVTKGVNGSIVADEVDGSLEVRGVNGRVQVGSVSGAVDLKGINGNVVLSLEQLNLDAVALAGINGNIELRLANGVNGYLDAKGMNGRVVSDSSEVTIEKGKQGRYWAQIGTGGNSISAKGINGNIKLTRSAATATATTEQKVESKAATTATK